MQPVTAGEDMAVTGYCVKCKASIEIKDPEAVTMKNGKPATSGTCPTCGTRVFKIGKAS
jgi:DNA-directed RNA polymerase subunit RPC12/RpoP